MLVFIHMDHRQGHLKALVQTHLIRNEHKRVLYQAKIIASRLRYKFRCSVAIRETEEFNLA